MSGVYIPGIGALKCDECFWCIGHRIKCHAQNIDVIQGNRRADCPLIPVPDHGRLIDADALILTLKDEKGSYFGYESAVIGEHVDFAPVVIPASEGAGR